MKKLTVVCLALLVIASVARQTAIAQDQETGAVPAAGTISICDVQYTGGADPQLLDVYLPADQGCLRPMVIYIHGGYWLQGDKRDYPEMFLPLVEAGYIVFSINYRLTGSAPYPAQLEDCKAAVRWARDHAALYAGDPERIAAVGVSAGGHLAALLGTSGGVAELEGHGGCAGVSSRVQAVVDWFGPADLTLVEAATGHDVTPVEQLLGGSLAAVQDQAWLASPTSFISPDDPPFLIIHGTADPVVPFAQSQYFVALLTEAGVQAELVTVPGGGHGGFAETEPGEAELLRRVVEFLDHAMQEQQPGQASTAPAGCARPIAAGEA